MDEQQAIRDADNLLRAIAVKESGAMAGDVFSLTPDDARQARLEPHTSSLRAAIEQLMADGMIEDVPEMEDLLRNVSSAAAADEYAVAIRLTTKGQERARKLAADPPS